jgi:SPP1 family predicted phage head-tail adaptor
MRAGKLRQRITIQSRTLTQDSLGQAIETWSDVATVPAEVTMASGAEPFNNRYAQEVATITHRIRIRHRDNMTPLNRVIYRDRVLDVLNVGPPPNEDQRMLMLHCSERVGEAE